MYKKLQAIYKRLLLIPGVGPMARIPVLSWRILRNRPLGPALSPTTISDTLALTVAALDRLRTDYARIAETIPLLEASLAGVRSKHKSLSTENENNLKIVETRAIERIEFIRAEMMYELRSQLRLAPPTASKAINTESISPKIINKTLVDSQSSQKKIRLNLGCGHVPLTEFLNIDRRELPGVDIIAEVADLPFERAAVSEIYSAHLLEHFPIEHLRRVILPYWKSLLHAGGELKAVVPDAEAMLQDYSQSNMSFEDLREVTYGGQEYEGDFHYAMFSYSSLAQILEEAGFSKVCYSFKARKNGKCRDMEIQAERP